MNILIPVGGKSRFFENAETAFPKPLLEILGKPMIQHTLENLRQGVKGSRYIFILRKEDCERFHLDNTISLLIEDSPLIIKQAGETKGAACSCLLAIDAIENDEELLICNSDQVFSGGIQAQIDQIRALNADAAVLTFESVHPQWSYVRTDDRGHVLEAAEKNPISKNAIAGIYYFKKGRDFVAAAKKMILNDASVNQNFFIAPSLNEFILKGQSVFAVKIPNGKYHSFYSLEKIREFEMSESERSHSEN